MSKKKLFILFTLSMVLVVSLLTVNASSTWSFDFNGSSSSPYLDNCKGYGGVAAYDDSFLNPFDNDSCYAYTNINNSGGPTCNITCQAAVNYSSGGSLKYIYSQTESRTVYNNTWYTCGNLSVSFNPGISNAITAYGYHRASVNNLGTRSGTSNESF